MSPLSPDARAEVREEVHQALAQPAAPRIPTGADLVAAELTERTRVSWPVVLALLAAAATGATAIARAQDTSSRLDDVARQTGALQASDAENRADHRAIRELLEQIRQDVRDLKADARPRRQP